MPTRLLLVEDDELNARVITVMCELAGYEVVRADDGLSALYVLWSERIDVVLLDVRLPVLDGPSLLRILRAHHSFDHLPVIALTAMTAPAVRAELLELGASGVLLKPFARKDLMTSLARAMADTAAAC
ncbi:Polar-differentiation response regulator DivK [compost metagenome]